MRLTALLLATVAVCGVRAAPADAHDFPPPLVRVVVSDEPPGGHPTQQTIIEVPEGPGYDRVTVVAPLGSTIASDADIPDGTVVGRLDAMATTNAITRPVCDLRVEFTVPVTEATADPDSAQYPPYLRELVPGRHRLRLVADVSPSPDIPILINSLVDVDPDSGALTTHVVVGDPTHPPEQFRSCTPQRSKNTLFGVTPDGTPLLTSPPTPAAPARPFTYTFTSRPDEDGHRHEQTVTVEAEVGEIDVPPLVPSRPGPDTEFPAPTNLRIRTDATGLAAYLSWDYDLNLTREFFATVTYPHPEGGTITEILQRGDGPWAAVPRHLVQLCDQPQTFVYRVAASTESRVRSEFAELVGGSARDVSCVTFAPGGGAGGIVAPVAGDGSETPPGRSPWADVALLGAGLVFAGTGATMRARRGRS